MLFYGTLKSFELFLANHEFFWSIKNWNTVNVSETFQERSPYYCKKFTFRRVFDCILQNGSSPYGPILLAIRCIMCHCSQRSLILCSFENVSKVKVRMMSRNIFTAGRRFLNNNFSNFEILCFVLGKWCYFS